MKAKIITRIWYECPECFRKVRQPERRSLYLKTQGGEMRYYADFYFHPKCVRIAEAMPR